ncbi:MAG: PTS sugar transporter subunit IIA [Candidatus Eisenbacteria bacterium]|uniref:PTS sugar transporter subunit IIA n=1 Tax=Eiseniibacteriota bacterium TaxID=2212470 RepID=A0A948RYJ7_UNCEI|nr:PTS sugar transporter subunit IIA [Candidatus Eisenbacteria bacterium]
MLKSEMILMELETENPPEPEDASIRDRYIWNIKDSVLKELADLMDKSGRVGNRTRLLRDLQNRERKATTGIGRGFAIPHVRTREAREFLFGLARSTAGVHFDALDQDPVHIFLCFVAPPHDDQLYLSIYRRIAEAITTTTVLEELMAARDEGEILRAMKWFD